jgi:hypothetical protein
MWFQSWINVLRSRTHTQWRRSSDRYADRRRPLTRRPLFEGLEQRQLLTFAAAVDYPAGDSPQAVLTADFNNDFVLDVAVANTNSGLVSVLLGNADGTLQPAISSSAGNQPSSLAVGDFNGDGKLDIATGDPGLFGTTADVTVLLGQGNGSFQAPVVIDLIYSGNYGVDKFVTSVAVGDFNSDGKLDIGAVTNFYDDFFGEVSRAAVLLGTGAGTFGSPNWSYISLQPSYSATVADFNADGKLDIASTNSMLAFVALGTGTGSFAWQTNNYYHLGGATVFSIVAADVNNDGKVDLAAAGVGSGGSFVSAILGDGNGSFGTAQTYNTGNGQNYDLAVADFNGDGKLDVVTSDAETGTVSALLGNGNGALTHAGAYAVDSSPSAVTVGDFNGDGRPDVATANASASTVSVLLNDGAWSTPLPIPRISIGDVTRSEGKKGKTTLFTFTVTLSAASDQPVTMSFQTVNGTATTAGNDYVAKTGTLTFAPGQTTKTITIEVKGDRNKEVSETFYLDLFGLSSNAQFTKNRGTGTILNDD